MTACSKKRPADAFRSAFAFSLGHWRRQPGLIFVVTGAIIASTLADIFIPVFAGRIVDAIAATDLSRDDALHAALYGLAGVFGLGLLGLIMRQLAWHSIIPFTLRIMSDTGQDAFRRVQRFSSDWHANTFAGSTVRKITRGMWALDTLHDTVLLAMLPSFCVLVGTVVLMGVYWPAMGLVVALFSVVYLCITVLLATRWAAPAARLSNQWDSRMGGVLADSVTCNSVVKSFGAEEREEARLSRIIAKWKKRTYRTWARYTWASGFQVAVLLLLRLALTSGAILLWWQGRATAGDATYLLTTSFVVHGYLRDVGMHINNLQRAVNEMEELVDLQNVPVDVADRPGAEVLRVSGGEIRFDHVAFHYEGHDTPLYRDLDLTIKAGERVGLVGHSGSGKTTFVKLIQRLYDVTGGRVLIDGQDISCVTQHSLRRQIAIVQQEPILFHRTLAENIAYARPEASMDEIEHAARLANAEAFIERLPKGYQTMVGERGIKLSGGERQRIALARAFLANAPILILDEATSSLDSESEVLIQQAMERLMQGRTAIVIAHRLSTVRSMDRILVFDKGEVVEEGRHGDLVQRPEGQYRRLFETQAEGSAL